MVTDLFNFSRRFIHERIRHLVDAFSNRTNIIRRQLELPPTPSSLSSLDEVDPTPSLPSLPGRPISGLTNYIDDTALKKPTGFICKHVFILYHRWYFCENF